MTIYEQVDARKAAIDVGRPFEGEMLRQLKAYYRVVLTWTSNALEGNSLTEVETKVLLEDGLTVGGKPLRDTFEALGHAEAYDFMFTLLRNRIITESDALTMHRMFYKGIEEGNAGQYREVDVYITGSKYSLCKADKIAGEMVKLFAWANGERDKMHPVEFAAQLHKRFVFIHPSIY
jgi:Fic family protein